MFGKPILDFLKKIIFGLVGLIKSQARLGRDRQRRRAALYQTQPPVLNSTNPNSNQAINHASFPLAFIDQQDYWRPLDLGGMNVLCPSCEAKHWIDERSSSSSKTAPRFESCCKKGDVAISKLSTLPDVLRALLQKTRKKKNIFARISGNTIAHYHSPH